MVIHAIAPASAYLDAVPRLWSPFVAMVVVLGVWAAVVGWMAPGPIQVLAATLPIAAVCVLGSAWAGPRARGWLRPTAVMLALGLLIVCAWRAYGSVVVRALPVGGLIATWLLATAIAAVADAGRRTTAIAVVGALLGAMTLAPTLDLPVGWPRGMDPLRPAPLAAAPAEDASAPVHTGRREGMPTRHPEDAESTCATSPRFVTATEAPAPWKAPLVLAVGWPADTELTIARGHVDTALASEACHLLDLLPYDALLLGPEPVLEEGRDLRARRRLAEAVARYVRGGGCVIGPDAALPWPAGLDKAFGSFGQVTENGRAGARSLGLGGLARAASFADAAALILDDVWIPPVRSGVDRARAPLPELPPAVHPGGEVEAEPAPEAAAGTEGILLGLALVLLATVGVLGWALRDMVRAAAALALLLGATLVGSGLIEPPPASPRVAALRIELGGPDGRRIELVHIQAPRHEPFEAQVTWPRSGWLDVRRGALDGGGTLRLGPGEDAWLVWQGDAEGEGPEERPNRGAGWTLGFLKGRPDPKQVAYGWIPDLGVRIGGLAPIPATTLHVRSR